MDSLKLQVNENTFDLLFSYKCFRLLAEKWKLNSMQEVLQVIETSSKGLEQISFDALDKIASLVEAGILAGENPEQLENFDSDKFCDFLLHNINVISDLFEYLGKCMPKQSEPEKAPATKSLKSKPAL